MRVRIEMFLTILIVSVALRAEPELHLRAVHFGSAADRALMLGDTRTSPHISLKLLPPVYLLRI